MKKSLTLAIVLPVMAGIMASCAPHKNPMNSYIPSECQYVIDPDDPDKDESWRCYFASNFEEYKTLKRI